MWKGMFIFIPSSSSTEFIVRGLDVSLPPTEVQVSGVRSVLGGCFVLKAVIILSTKGLQKGLSIQILSPTASSTYN